MIGARQFRPSNKLKYAAPDSEKLWISCASRGFNALRIIEQCSQNIECSESVWSTEPEGDLHNNADGARPRLAQSLLLEDTQLGRESSLIVLAIS